MTKIQKIQLRQSEVRQKLNELLGVEDRTAEQATELSTLTGDAQRLEVEFRATLAAEPPADDTTETGTETGDAETRERAEIRSRASLASYLDAAIRGRSVDGAEAELAAALRLCRIGPAGDVREFASGRPKRGTLPRLRPPSGQRCPPSHRRYSSGPRPRGWESKCQASAVAMPDIRFSIRRSLAGRKRSRRKPRTKPSEAFTVKTAQPRRITGSRSGSPAKMPRACLVWHGIGATGKLVERLVATRPTIRRSTAAATGRRNAQRPDRHSGRPGRTRGSGGNVRPVRLCDAVSHVDGDARG